MPTRPTLRAEAMEVAEELALRVKRNPDPMLSVLAERNLVLLAVQYAGIERCLDELQYAGPTRATLRMERESAKLMALEAETRPELEHMAS